MARNDPKHTDIPEVIALDFETEPIYPRPHYPPKPVGFSVGGAGLTTKYYAFGHPTENNCTWEEARGVLQRIWGAAAPIVFHNAKFDTDVAETFFNLPPLDWRRVHDTMILLFLYNPHAPSFALKAAAEDTLGIPPLEKAELEDWLVGAGFCRKGAKDMGAYIYKAPGKLVGKYADGDVIRTELLFQHLYPFIAGGMLEAYDRERELLPTLLLNEREGVCVDTQALNSSLEKYEKILSRVDSDLQKRLKTPDLSLDSGGEFADALERCGVVTTFPRTKPSSTFPDGQRSTAKGALTADMFNDQTIAALWGYRNKIANSVRTFLRPWSVTAGFTGGRIHTNWNQVRQIGGGFGSAGARTGRLSSSPNFQNITKNWVEGRDGFPHPRGYPEPPLLRKLILPDKGHVVGHRDYSQQELRILAHFADGSLLDSYNYNPAYDVHGLVQTGLREALGYEFPRDNVKRFVFQKLYGGGIPAIMGALDCSESTARAVVSALLRILPGYARLEQDVKLRGRSGGFVTTWGGRRYFVEPPTTVDGRTRTYEYKLLNYLIQGSAADCTKQAINNYNAIKKEGRLLLTVHDEINISVPAKAAKEEMALLDEAMRGVKFDVPMLTEGKIGPNWGSLEKFRE